MITDRWTFIAIYIYKGNDVLSYIFVVQSPWAILKDYRKNIGNVNSKDISKNKKDRNCDFSIILYVYFIIFMHLYVERDSF